MGIWETLRQALARLVMREAGYQAKMVCGNLQLCAGLEAGIEGGIRTVGPRKIESTQRGRGAEVVDKAE